MSFLYANKNLKTKNKEACFENLEFTKDFSTYKKQLKWKKNADKNTLNKQISNLSIPHKINIALHKVQMQPYKGNLQIQLNLFNTNIDKMIIQ